jgi:glycosyltransferase involved in cell wall biosynthesis
MNAVLSNERAAQMLIELIRNWFSIFGKHIYNTHKILASADFARDQSDWHNAVSLYTRYLAANPRDAAIWVQLGNCAKEANLYSRSAFAYQRALKIDPNSSDTYLQIGHLSKVSGNLPGAVDSYIRALDFRPVNLDAFEELERMNLVDQATEIILKKNLGSLRNEGLLVFDITDLVFYIGHHDNLSGIQRVQCCVMQAIMKYRLHDPQDLRFISYDRSLRAFRSVCPDKFLALLDDLALPKDRRTIEFDAAAARCGRLFPTEPLAAFLRPGRTTVVLLGAAWVIPEYASLIVNLKRAHDTRFAMLFHDLIPIYARETCDQGTAVVFKEFLDQVLPLVDLAMCVSQSTERDLKRYCGENGFLVPSTLVTQLGTYFDEFFPGSEDASPPRTIARPRDPFVLFVSTIEGRKNHNFMFEIWRTLVERGVDVPRLVCVGRIGWRAETFLTNVLETNYLGGRIELREDVSDEVLNALYRDCLFTVFPSVYEGWGLPIGESLGHGKLCVLADNSSLPEVAGEFGCFISIEDVEAAADTIASLLDDPDRLAAYEQAIAERFRPRRWEEVAQRVIDGCLTLQDAETPAYQRPLVSLGKEYTVKKLQGGFDGLLGRAMLDAMEESFAAPILGGMARVSQRIAGLLARDTNWHESEVWGCWALRERAGLQFALDPAGLAEEGELLLYGAFKFSASMLGARMRLLISGTPLDDELLIDSPNPVLVWSLPVAELRRRAPENDDGTLAVDLRFELADVTPAMREASRAIDPRELTFGLRSFLLLGASEIAERLRIAERNGYKLAC